MLANYVDGQSYTLVSNPHYVSTTFHGPFISQLIYRAYPDVLALSGAVQKQQVTVSQGYMEYDLPYLAHLPSNIQVLQDPAASYEHLDFNNANPLFHDLNVRRAIQLAIDKCAILKDVFHTPNCSRLASALSLSKNPRQDLA